MKNAEVTQVFDDLDAYRKFCVANGYTFNEADLYKHKTPWGHMQNSIRTGRTPYNQWIRDGKAMRFGKSTKPFNKSNNVRNENR
jgi:hypothetical protein